jgi:hypothetical protein
LLLLFSNTVVVHAFVFTSSQALVGKRLSGVRDKEGEKEREEEREGGRERGEMKRETDG